MDIVQALRQEEAKLQRQLTAVQGRRDKPQRPHNIELLGGFIFGAVAGGREDGTGCDVPASDPPPWEPASCRQTI